MRLGRAKTGAVLLSATAIILAQAASAADMPSYYMPSGNAAPVDQPVPMEFGSGWYLRGDASFGPEDKPKLLLQNDAPTFSRKGSTFGYALGGGAGYKLTDGLRIDVTADYLDPFHYSAAQTCGTGCALQSRTTVQRWDGLLNGYYDIATWAGFTPYVGAGVGVAGTRERDTLAMGDGTSLSALNHSDTRFAWAAMAGVSYAVAPHVLLDIGYRYLDLGKSTITLLPSSTVSRSLSEQQIRVGVRYMVD
ncbi:MAG: outer membrane protein [Janthinobacterium lividum]